MPDAPKPYQPTRPTSDLKPEDTGRRAGDTATPGGAPAAADLELRPGARPVPEYVLLAKLGEGGFGQVWKARDADGFEVALKFLRLDLRTGAAEQRALEVMKNVRHPHVLPMFRSWQLGSWLVLALELGDKTLYQRLADAEKAGESGVPHGELLEYLREAAKGLDYLHALTIQHRDVKPQNLLLVGGSVKVADFGLAKLLEHSLASNSGSMTPSYAAPEQFQGQLSPHSDQYSLAASYCQLRGGRLPFEGGPHAVMFGHLQGQPDLSMIPEAERPAVARALAKKPEERWPSCRGFVEALARVVSPGTTADVTPTLPTVTPLPRRRPRRYALAGGLALLAVIAAGAAVGLLPRAAERRAEVGKPDALPPAAQEPAKTPPGALAKVIPPPAPGGGRDPGPDDEGWDASRIGPRTAKEQGDAVTAEEQRWLDEMLAAYAEGMDERGTADMKEYWRTATHAERKRTYDLFRQGRSEPRVGRASGPSRGGSSRSGAIRVPSIREPRAPGRPVGVPAEVRGSADGYPVTPDEQKQLEEMLASYPETEQGAKDAQEMRDWWPTATHAERKAKYDEFKLGG